MLEFNPFGKSDRAAEGQTGTQTGFNQQYSQSSHESSYAPQGGHEPAHYGKPAAPNYGGNYAVGVGEESKHSMDDDSLPF